MDAIAYLIQDESRTYDKYGNEIITPLLKQVYVQVGSVYSAEFYNAAQAGLRPNLRFWISHRVDYEGETHLIYEGQTYHVIRTDWEGDGVALICEEQVKEFDSWSE